MGTIASILLIDDEPGVLAAMRRTLQRDGYAIATAASAAEALNLLESRPFDLVCSDLMLPDMDGLTLLQNIASRWPSVVRFLVTGSGDADDQPDLFSSELAYRVVTKPWSGVDVRLAVKHALEHQRLVVRVAELEAAVLSEADRVAA